MAETRNPFSNWYNNSMMEPIIKAHTLQQIAGNEDLVIIDATSGVEAKKTYLDNHLLGAHFIDLDQDMSAVKDPKNGGRHPLPSPAEFSETLTKLGIDANSHVVVYDRLNGANAAARFWWMARAAGIKHVQVLDGGFRAAVANGFPVVQGEQDSSTQKNYRFNAWQLPVKLLTEINAWTRQEHTLIIDVREEARYQGEIEPIDLIAGHIPTAINVPFLNNLDGNGFFKDKQELRALYDPLLEGKDPKSTAVHCGSGVTACHTLLAWAHAGYQIPNLYVGSWSEWSRNDLPIEHNR